MVTAMPHHCGKHDHDRRDAVHPEVDPQRSTPSADLIAQQGHSRERRRRAPAAKTSSTEAATIDTMRAPRALARNAIGAARRSTPIVSAGQLLRKPSAHRSSTASSSVTDPVSV